MSLKTHDRFIEVYKSIESIIRELYPDIPEASFKWYEDQQTNIEYSNKLRLCRNIRNFIQHNKGYETFIDVTPEMQFFIEKVLLDLKLKKGIAWEITTTAGRCFLPLETDAIYNVAEGMAKRGLETCLVLTEQGTYMGLLTGKSLSLAITSGKQLKKTKINALDGLTVKPKNRVAFVRKDTEKEITIQYFKDGYEFVVVTDNGFQTGKVLGLVKNPF
jgi:hypothetical protein